MRYPQGLWRRCARCREHVRMKEIFDWKIVYEALSGIPLHYGVEVRDSVVVCSMVVEGTKALLGGSVRIDGEVIEDPDVVISILEGQRHYGNNGALIAVVKPRRTRGLDQFFAELSAKWPMAYHAGYVVHSEEMISASCACGTDIEVGDELELLATTASTMNAGRDVWANETFFRADRSPHSARARTMASLIEQEEGTSDSTTVTEIVLKGVAGSRLTMKQKAQAVSALGDVAFRDGLLSWASGTMPSPSDFRGFWSDYELPDLGRIDHTIDFLRGLCRWLPTSRAASPIASSAYLAWYSGNGLRARVLTEQAAQEDASYPLTRLMDRIIDAGAPPPWVSQRRERLVS